MVSKIFTSPPTMLPNINKRRLNSNLLFQLRQHDVYLGMEGDECDEGGGKNSGDDVECGPISDGDDVSGGAPWVSTLMSGSD